MSDIPMTLKKIRGADHWLVYKNGERIGSFHLEHGCVELIARWGIVVSCDSIHGTKVTLR